MTDLMYRPTSHEVGDLIDLIDLATDLIDLSIDLIVCLTTDLIVCLTTDLIDVVTDLTECATDLSK